MNKTELRDAIAKHTDLTSAQAERAIEAVFTTITATVTSGDKVTVGGFGTFSVRERPARTGRNPGTGEPLQIAASRAPVFKAAAAFKRAANS